MEHKKRADSGGVIIIVAVCILAIVCFLSLALDTAHLQIRRHQKQVTAEHAALAALESYMNEPDSAHGLRYRNAVRRAEAVAQLNFQGNFSDQPQVAAGELEAGVAGYVRSGRWWTERPAACVLAGCPCGASGETAAPCFQECDDHNGCANPATGNPGEQALAFKVLLRTPDASPVQNIFAGIFGSPTSHVAGGTIGSGSQTIAVVVPKVGVLYLDTTNFAASETHPDYRTTASGLGRPYEIPYCHGLFAAAADMPIVTPPFTSARLAAVPGACWPALFDARRAQALDSMTPAELGRYEALAYTTDSAEVWSSAASFPVSYASVVDVEIDPEPLSTVLHTASSIITQFQDNAYPEDLLLIARDHWSLQVPRFYGKESPELSRIRELAARIGAGESRAQRINIIRERLAKGLLIPEVAMDAHNAPARLTEAVRLLAERKAPAQAERYITALIASPPMVTAGVETYFGVPRQPCAGSIALRPYPERQSLMDIYAVFDSAEPWSREQSETTYARYRCQEDIFWTMGYLAQEMKNYGITLNVILMNKALAPHSVTYSSAAAGHSCMTEQEMREKNLLSVYDDGHGAFERWLTLGLAGAPPLSPSAIPFFGTAFHYYSMVRKTKGIWYPYRKESCPQSLEPDCSANANPLPESYSSLQAEQMPYAVRSASLIASGHMDGEGRLFCNPSSIDADVEVSQLFRREQRKRKMLLVQ